MKGKAQGVSTMTFILSRDAHSKLQHSLQESRQPVLSPGLLTRHLHQVSMPVEWQDVGRTLCYTLGGLLQSNALSFLRITLTEMTHGDLTSKLTPGYKPGPHVHDSLIHPLFPIPIDWNTSDTQPIVAEGTRPFSHVWSRRLKWPKICP